MPWTPPPSYSTYIKLKSDRQFRAAAREALVIQERIKLDEKRLAELKELLEPQMSAAGVPDNERIEFEGAHLAVNDQSGGERIDEKLLLANGVKRSVIDKSKVPNKRRRYVLLVPVRDVEEQSRKKTA
jgi:hypothetical protein